MMRRPVSGDPPTGLALPYATRRRSRFQTHEPAFPGSPVRPGDRRPVPGPALACDNSDERIRQGRADAVTYSCIREDQVGLIRGPIDSLLHDASPEPIDAHTWRPSQTLPRSWRRTLVDDIGGRRPWASWTTGRRCGRMRRAASFSRPARSRSFTLGRWRVQQWSNCRPPHRSAAWDMKTPCQGASPIAFAHLTVARMTGQSLDQIRPEEES
jgi:hypothetical protein